MGRERGSWRKWGITERAPCLEILVLLGDKDLTLGAHAGSKSRVGAQF